MRILLQHRLAAAVIGLAVAATGGVFLFALPKPDVYRPAGHPVEVPSYVERADHGWTWADGVPGFRFGVDEKLWNFALLHPSDLATLRAGAPAAGVDPQSLRVLDAARTAVHAKPYLIVAGSDAKGGTCIGAQPGSEPVQFFCAAQLKGHHAVVIAAPQAYYKAAGWSIHISGIVDASVRAVLLTTAGRTMKDMRSGKPVIRPEGPVVLLQTGDQTFGTFASFEGQPVPWRARLDFLGEGGKKLFSLPLRFHAPGASVYVR
jgi:hypothetical protein